MSKPPKPDMGRVQNPPEIVVGFDRLAREKTRPLVSLTPMSLYSDNPLSISNVLGPDGYLTPVE